MENNIFKKEYIQNSHDLSKNSLDSLKMPHIFAIMEKLFFKLAKIYHFIYDHTHIHSFKKNNKKSFKIIL